MCLYTCTPDISLVQEICRVQECIVCNLWQRTAMDNQAMFPDAASAILEKFCIDDYLDSVEYPDVAFELSQEWITLLALDGFKLTQ